MRAPLSGTLASTGGALPYALAAKFAEPDSPVIAVVGDRAMQMNGINGLIDAAHYHWRWSDPRLVVLVLNNGDLNQVTWEQRVLAGDPKLDASQKLPDFPFARYAELLGLVGIRSSRPTPSPGPGTSRDDPRSGSGRVNRRRGSPANPGTAAAGETLWDTASTAR